MGPLASMMGTAASAMPAAGNIVAGTAQTAGGPLSNALVQQAANNPAALSASDNLALSSAGVLPGQQPAAGTGLVCFLEGLGSLYKTQKTDQKELLMKLMQQQSQPDYLGALQNIWGNK